MVSPANQDEVTLIKRCQAGDKNAFAKLVERYYRTVYKAVHLIIADHHYAEDILQEVFMVAYRSLNNLRDPNKFKSWLYGIAYRICMNHLRVNKIRLQTAERIEEKAITRMTPETAAMNKEQTIIQVANSLPAEDREVIALRYFEDLSYKEIAGIIGISVDNVKIRLYRAKEMLTSLLHIKKE